MRILIQEAQTLAYIIFFVTGIVYGDIGVKLGEFSTLAHGVSGEVYAVNEYKLFIQDFHYDGAGPDAYFTVGEKSKGVGAKPDSKGTVIPIEAGSNAKLGAYASAELVLLLPNKLVVSKLRWISVWCRAFTANFGEVIFSNSTVKMIKSTVMIGKFKTVTHNTKSDDVRIEDEKTFLINNMYYDGIGPDAFFIVGNGTKVWNSTIHTKVPDEKGSLSKAHGYSGETIRLTLPGILTMYEIGWLMLYDIHNKEVFGDVNLPVSIVDGSLPPHIITQAAMRSSETSLDNCENVHKRFNVGWTITSTDIEVEMIGILETDEYLAFGISGSPSVVRMVGADVAIGFYAMTGTAHVLDYDLNAKSQCSKDVGVCPDSVNNVKLKSATIIDGTTRFHYSRPRSTGDPVDKVYSLVGSTSVIWAIGKVNSEGTVTKHHTIAIAPTLWYLARIPSKNCKLLQQPDAGSKTTSGWTIPALIGKNTTEFIAEIGQAGGDQGYTHIVGKQSWGIAWYINEQLIPEITLQRGRRYTFIIKGGSDPKQPAKYHPFYITDSAAGGSVQSSSEELKKEKLFAGIGTDGKPTSNATGQYCEWKSTGVDQADKSRTFAEYKATLQRQCDGGTPGKLTWTPDKNTPDVVYYQCFTHRNLGWKIHIVDDFNSATEQNHKETLILVLATSLCISFTAIFS